MKDFIESTRMRTWAEIDLNNIENNFKVIKSQLKKDTKLCCTVKANGYGHGALMLSKIYEALGADFLAVSNIEEALELRQGGISLPILILGYTNAECAKTLSENNISQCVYSLEYGTKLAQNAQKAGVKVKIHIKLDTGMGRLGFLCRRSDENELAEALSVCRLPSLIHEGIFTHFAVADEKELGEKYTRKQYNHFSRAIDFFKSNGVSFDFCHAANSAGIFDYTEFQLNMVRAGIVLYGLTPTRNASDIPSLSPAMNLYSVISHVKNLKKGDSVSYGRTFCAKRDMRVATVPIGYADGFFRATQKKGYSLVINGKETKILGRVCMDQLIIDVSDIECNMGDIVTVFDENHHIDVLAAANDTISYEIVCAISKRVPRAYIKDGKFIAWNDTK